MGLQKGLKIPEKVRGCQLYQVRGSGSGGFFGWGPFGFPGFSGSRFGMFSHILTALNRDYSWDPLRTVRIRGLGLQVVRVWQNAPPALQVQFPKPRTDELLTPTHPEPNLKP